MIENHSWGVSPSVDRIWSHVAGMRPRSASRRGYMVLQAYVDDSGSGGSPCFVLAGYIAPAEKWAAFSAEWESILPSHGVRSNRGNKNYHFKMSSMLGSEERRARIPAFEHIIYKYASSEFAFGIRLDNYHRAVNRLFVPGIESSLFRPKITPFYFVFYGIMECFSRWLRDSGQVVTEWPIDFFFDKTKEKGHIVSNWQNYINTTPSVAELFGSMPRIEDDEVFLPIHAADNLASNFRRLLQGEITSYAWSKRKPEDFPGFYVELSEENMYGMYYRMIRSALPNHVILDSDGWLHPERIDRDLSGPWQFFGRKAE